MYREVTESATIFVFDQPKASLKVTIKGSSKTQTDDNVFKATEGDMIVAECGSGDTALNPIPKFTVTLPNGTNTTNEGSSTIIEFAAGSEHVGNITCSAESSYEQVSSGSLSEVLTKDSLPVRLDVQFAPKFIEKAVVYVPSTFTDTFSTEICSFSSNPVSTLTVKQNNNSGWTQLDVNDTLTTYKHISCN